MNASIIIWALVAIVSIIEIVNWTISTIKNRHNSQNHRHARHHIPVIQKQVATDAQSSATHTNIATK